MTNGDAFRARKATLVTDRLCANGCRRRSAGVLEVNGVLRGLCSACVVRAAQAAVKAKKAARRASAC